MVQALGKLMGGEGEIAGGIDLLGGGGEGDVVPGRSQQVTLVLDAKFGNSVWTQKCSGERGESLRT